MWYIRPVLRTSILNTVDTISVSLDASQEILKVVDSSIVQADSSLTDLIGMLSEVSLVLESTTGLMLNVSDILVDDLAPVINGTIQGLRGLEKTTLLVDNTLLLVSSIPFFGGERYRPTTPLNQSISQISKDLAEMPVSIRQISVQLDNTSEGLHPILETLNQLSADLSVVQSNLESASFDISEYQLVISEAQTRIYAFQDAFPVYLDGVYIGITLMAVWIVLAQIGLFTQGLEKLRS